MSVSQLGQDNIFYTLILGKKIPGLLFLDIYSSFSEVKLHTTKENLSIRKSTISYKVLKKRKQWLWKYDLNLTTSQKSIRLQANFVPTSPIDLNHFILSQSRLN